MIKNLMLRGRNIEYKYMVAVIYGCVLFLDRLDLTIVNVTLPTIAKYFQVPITLTEWITNGFLLALAISIPISGWAGDRFGVKRVFTIATAAFGLSSLLCAFAPNIFSMALMRFIQGLAGGIIIPVGMTMVYRVFDHSEYASITSFIFIPTLIAPAIAPALGGAIIHLASWKWVFIFAAPICSIAVILALLILKEQKVEDKPALDWGGFLLASCALILILYFISALGKNGFDLETCAIFVFAMLFSYFFFLREKRAKLPLIDIKFFKNKLFLQANLMQLAFQICHFGSIFLVGMYLQVGVGMSALVTGLIVGTQALGAMCSNRYSVKLFKQSGPILPVTIGFVGVAIFTTCILFIDQPRMIFFGIVILFIRGLFSGLCGTPIQTASVIGFTKNEVSRASAIFNAGRQISISLGVGLSALLISYGFKAHGLDLSHFHGDVARSSFYYAFGMIPLAALIGIIIVSTVDNKKIILMSSKKN